MQTVPRADLAELRHWFAPELPSPMIFAHIMGTGNGSVRVDRWPDPRVVLAELGGGNVALRGDPAHLPACEIAGFVDAPAEWLPTLEALAPGVATWDRVVALLPADAAVPPTPPGVRRLGPGDADALAALDPHIAWIHETWGGATGLAEAAVAFGAFDGDRLVSVASPFYVGTEHEDLGVVTAADHRGRGLSSACAAAVVSDVRARGHVPVWTTSPDNLASLGVARRLGFVQRWRDVLYAVGVPIPIPE